MESGEDMKKITAMDIVASVFFSHSDPVRVGLLAK